jgi:hypothetical protein
LALVEEKGWDKLIQRNKLKQEVGENSLWRNE